MPPSGNQWVLTLLFAKLRRQTIRLRCLNNYGVNLRKTLVKVEQMARDLAEQARLAAIECERLECFETAYALRELAMQFEELPACNTLGVYPESFQNN